MGKIEIRHGRTGSDCTSQYYVTVPNGMTVREFIDEWMEDTSEWGYFGINNGVSVFGSPRCEYSHGEIVTNPLPDNYLDAPIKSVSGSGGWSRSDFIFTI